MNETLDRPKLDLKKRENIVQYVINGDNTLETEFGFIQIQDMGTVKTVEELDFYVNVLMFSNGERVHISRALKEVNGYINTLTQKYYGCETVSYIRDYTIVVDDGVKEVVTKRTVTYKR
jgi:hypothetical protein